MFGGIRRHSIGTAIVCAALLLGGCSPRAGKGTAGTARYGAGKLVTDSGRQKTGRRAAADLHIADLVAIPQNLHAPAARAADRFALADACRDRLQDEFRSRFFAPWTATGPAFDPVGTSEFMKHEGRSTWYGINKRKVPPEQLQELVANCALESFPSRSDTAIAVAPAHLRGLPTYLPLFTSAEDYPFDMLSYPQVKLNEPLRVMHASRDGVWLFVETGYTNGWIERRNVALVDRGFVDSWMQAPHLVVVRDYMPVPDGAGVAVHRAKVGTILPLVQAGADLWEVSIASAGEGGKVQSRPVRIPRAAAAPFPLAFNRENLGRVGNQLLGEPYGWGEIYDLRDCSALLRDFFLPFGIWLPRTSADQIASLPHRVELAGMTPAEKEAAIRERGVPFLTLLHKPGHIVLYVGVDDAGLPLVFNNAWSIRLKDASASTGAKGSAEGDEGAKSSYRGGTSGGAERTGAGVPPPAKNSPACRGEKTQIIGVSAITTLEPGKELGLVPGSSLLERITELGTITNRCQGPALPVSLHEVSPVE